MSDGTTDRPIDASAVTALFRQTYGRDPDVVASAPGRVNLIGEHTDYNGGEVLPIAIARRTWLAAARRDVGSAGAVLRAISSTEPGAGTASLAAPVRSGNWWDYVLGVAAPLMHSVAARESLDIAVMSDVPTGAGLSSSAALEVATAVALQALLGQEPDATAAAMAGWHAETDFVGVEVGIMDQFASALSHVDRALHIDCETRRTDLVPFTDAVLIVDSAVRRSLRNSAFNERRAECREALRLLRERWPGLASLAAAEPQQVLEARLPAPLDRRAMHVSQETRRVREAVALLRAGQPLTRELLVGSHVSLRDLYECSRPELDWLVEKAIGLPGVRGARLTGAGWGGCVILVGDADALAAASTSLASGYAARFDLVPRLWFTTAAEGARIDSRE